MQHNELCGGYAFATSIIVNRREQKGISCDYYRFFIVIYVTKMSDVCRLNWRKLLKIYYVLCLNLLFEMHYFYWVVGC